MTPAILVSGTERRASLGMAAAVAVEGAALTGAGTLLMELGEHAQRRGPTLLAAPAARRIEQALRGQGLRGSARGHICHLALPGGVEALAAAAGAIAVVEAELVVVHLPGPLWVQALEVEDLRITGGCLLVSLPAERSLAALAAGELERRGLPIRIATRPQGPFAARRALAGARPGGTHSDSARRIARRLLGLGRARRERAGPSRARRGQALPALVGAGLILILAAVALAAIGGAATGRGRVQRAADLVALSAVRSMRDDVPRLLAPGRLPDGAPNPRHLSHGQYLSRARLAAVDAARHNDVDPARLRIAFPDAAAIPPLRARATIVGEVDPGQLPGGDRLADRSMIRVVASAVAEASAPVSSWTGMPPIAEGGYSGPLIYRDGEGMRPDVAAAFDRMSAAARHAGIDLVVVSGFRSDAEQAELFARHPDPRWVAPPGHSLHRCATELDLGPSSAYGWLAASARRFGFVQRYSWEAWHFGFAAGPPPCSQAGNATSPDGRAAGAESGGRLPSFVPAQYREAVLRSASRWNVSPGLLAAQLMAESGFNPRAVSPAGALGIAQFMPATARSYGLRDPFDPIASIDAQAHLMSDLLRRFHSVPLALAAYNAGAGAVAACSCVPYAETRAYVARILALADGAGVLLSPPLEVRLIR